MCDVTLGEKEQGLVLTCRSVDAETRINVVKSIEALGEYDRCLIRMRYYEGRRINEMATRLHKSTETVRRHLRRAEERLKPVLTDRAAFPDPAGGEADTGIPESSRERDEETLPLEWRRQYPEKRVI